MSLINPQPHGCMSRAWPAGSMPACNLPPLDAAVYRGRMGGRMVPKKEDLGAVWYYGFPDWQVCKGMSAGATLGVDVWGSQVWL